jgi:hypothetical protein
MPRVGFETTSSVCEGDDIRASHRTANVIGSLNYLRNEVAFWKWRAGHLMSVSLLCTTFAKYYQVFAVS